MPDPEQGEATVVAALCDSILLVTAGSGLTHASVTRAPRATPAVLAHASSREAAALFDLQEGLGEGPTRTTLGQREPVFVGDLHADPSGTDWVLFGGEAVRLGVRAVYATPLLARAVAVGVLTLHGPRPAREPPSGAEFAALRSALGIALLGSWHLLDPEGRGDRFTSHSAVVHQAAGMVTVQAGTTMADALLRLQAHALGHGLTLATVARFVVDRVLRFDDHDDVGWLT